MKLKQIADLQTIGFSPLAAKKSNSLSLIDVGLLYHHLIAKKLDASFEEILLQCQLKWSYDLESFFKILPQLPNDFCQWAATKDLGLNELKILIFATEHFQQEYIQSFLEKLVSLNPTRQIGAKILEYYFELTNIDISKATNADELLQTLYEKRFPRTAKNDSEYIKKVQSFPWPAHIKAQWLRKGDQAGVEIKIFATSSDDFNKKISALNNLKDKGQQKIWD